MATKHRAKTLEDINSFFQNLLKETALTITKTTYRLKCWQHELSNDFSALIELNNHREVDGNNRLMEDLLFKISLGGKVLEMMVLDTRESLSHNKILIAHCLSHALVFKEHTDNLKESLQ